MRIRRDLIDEIVAHSREARPRDEQGEECCGLIGGANDEMTSVHRARNAAATWLRYEVHPTDQIRIMDRIEEDGEELEDGNIVFLIPDDGWKYLSSGVYTKPIDEIENLDSTVWW